MPINDVRCYIANTSTDLDSYSKKLVAYQIGQKIYVQPEKKVTMHVTPKKSSDAVLNEDSTHPSMLKRSKLAKEKVIKVNIKHIREKTLTVDDVDLEYLQKPIRSSTPTPNISSSTILAGHLDVSILETFEATHEHTEAEDTDDDDSDDFLQQYMTKKKPSPSPVTCLQKKDPHIAASNTYCKDWMDKQQGVSSTNSDVPPSLYAPSVAISETLMDVTSVTYTCC